jgi:hypothetical protein
MKKKTKEEDWVLPKQVPIFINYGKYKPLPRKGCKNCTEQ